MTDPREALAHLREADPVLARAVEVVDPEDVRLEREDGSAFEALCRSIVHQQLGGAAAATIWRRFRDLCDGEVTPARVAGLDEERLRNAGLSRSKAAYLRGLAGAFRSGALDPTTFPAMDDDELVANLVHVKGIGPWTARMFLLFHLARPDVFAPGDLGLRKAAEDLYNDGDELGQAELLAIAETWRPHRSTACLVLWRWKEHRGL